MKLSLLIFLSFLTLISFSQQTRIDSLLYKLKSAKEDTNKVNILNNLCRELSDINPQKANIYGEQALLIAKKLRFQKGIANSYNNIGIIYANFSNYDKALEYFHKSLKIVEKFDDKMQIAIIYSNIGNIYLMDLKLLLDKWTAIKN